MLKKNGQSMQMGQKAIKLLLFFIVAFHSCTNFKAVPNSIYGKWVDTHNGNFIILIDSSSSLLTIDYSAFGGAVYKEEYSINSKNEIQSDILPRGAKIVFDKKGQLRFYPLDQMYTKDIESIYVFTFRKE